MTAKECEGTYLGQRGLPSDDAADRKTNVDGYSTIKMSSSTKSKESDVNFLPVPKKPF
ncbi:hypothetical protein [Vibrio ziniensis]|uniref:Uncharacterized protein n=1 Tax=Vibrio ziniensis TaxID=2711221 RepID=A0A6G7CPA3_9VIBR|nr:hypothetical protein [Vibrio ziniensis]QIH43883.1 hypothetical protein G5S32_18045 [Vibrio ziniensis]